MLKVVANALLPEKFEDAHLGGTERRVVLIDVDGKFNLSRLVQIIRQRTAQRSSQDQADPGSAIDVGSLIRECLRHLEIIQVVDPVELLLSIQALAYSRRRVDACLISVCLSTI